MRRSFVRALCALGMGACLLGSQASSAQSLSEVVVRDFWTYDGGFGPWGTVWYDNRTSGGGEPMPGYFQMVALANELKALLHVRCSGGAYRDVTSRNAPEDRWLAAETVFRAAKQTQSMFTRVFGSGNSPFQGGHMTVVFADGGSETYYIVNPQLSSALPTGPIPGSLKEGDGVIQPHYACK